MPTAAATASAAAPKQIRIAIVPIGNGIAQPMQSPVGD
jgi:hypothetical protein